MKTLKTLATILFVMMIIFVVMTPTFAFAENGEQVASEDGKYIKTIAVAIAIGLTAGCGAIAMGLATGKTSEAISRQPEAKNDIRSSFMLGLVFIETAIIYALLAAILIIFVM